MRVKALIVKRHGDQWAVNQRLKRACCALDDVEVREVEGFEQAMARISESVPDLVILQVAPPGKDGLGFIHFIRAANNQIRFMVVSPSLDPAFANRALRAGADGYVTDQEPFEELVQALNDVPNGQLYLSEQILTAPSSTGAHRTNGSAVESTAAI